MVFFWARNCNAYCCCTALWGLTIDYDMSQPLLASHLRELERLDFHTSLRASIRLLVVFGRWAAGSGSTSIGTSRARARRLARSVKRCICIDIAQGLSDIRVPNRPLSSVMNGCYQSLNFGDKTSLPLVVQRQSLPGFFCDQPTGVVVGCTLLSLYIAFLRAV